MIDPALSRGRGPRQRLQLALQQLDQILLACYTRETH
jgi:hypothetical protein